MTTKFDSLLNKVTVKVQPHDGTLHFGKFKGKTFQEVFNADPQYLKWVAVGMDAKDKQFLIDDKRKATEFLRHECLKNYHGQELTNYQSLSDEELISCVIPDIARPKLECGDYQFRFGKHKGKTIKEVYEKDGGYLLWYVNDNKEEVNKYLINGLGEKPDGKTLFLSKVADFLELH